MRTSTGWSAGGDESADVHRHYRRDLVSIASRNPGTKGHMDFNKLTIKL